MEEDSLEANETEAGGTAADFEFMTVFADVERKN